MTSSTLLTYDCNRNDGHEAIAHKSAYDENGNILPKFLGDHEGTVVNSVEFHQVRSARYSLPFLFSRSNLCGGKAPE